MLHRNLALVLAAALAAPTAHASCGASSCPIELHALTPNENGFTLDLSFQYIDQNRARQGSAFSGEEEHRELRTINRLTALQLSAPLSSRFEFAVTVPFVDRWHEHLDLQANELERWSFHGLGDVAMQLRTRLLSFDDTAPKSLWLTTGVKLPTGEKHEPALGGGENAEIMIVPGSGSVDAMVGLSYQGGVVRNTVLWGPFGGATVIPYFVSATYRRNGRGTDDYRLGDELLLNAGTEYPIARRLDVLAQINARLRAKDDPGTTSENRDLTGGRFLYVSPGLRFELRRNASVYAYAQIPLHQHVNGVQLTAPVNYLVGVRQHF